MEKKNKETLSKQPPVSLEQARAQVKMLSEQSTLKNKKKKI